MAVESSTLLFGFNVGEKSVYGLARIDQAEMKLAAEIQENLIPRTVGAAQFRPGTSYIGEVYDSDETTRLIPFIREVGDTALLELSPSILRVWYNDELVTRSAVSSTITSGAMNASTGWTATVSGTGIADINVTNGGQMTLGLPSAGDYASYAQSVSTSSANEEHAIRIIVDKGPVNFQIGTLAGGSDLIDTTSLDTGTHSLAFTPTTVTYHIMFIATRTANATIESAQIESAGAMTLPAPWSGDDIPTIQHDQSLDVVFLACTSFQQRRIEHRGDHSWSITKYKTDDGPFTTTSTAPHIALQPNVNFGNGYLTATGSFFNSSMVGTLFRLSHPGVNFTQGISAQDQYTSPSLRLHGVGVTGSNVYTMGVSGTWSGTVQQQMSLDGATFGFADTTTKWTSNSSTTYTPTATYDNVTFYLRQGFNSGAYTSGTAICNYIQVGCGGWSGICRVTSYISPTVVGMEVLSPFSDVVATYNWQEGEWSESRGWPGAVGFFEGRLWWCRGNRVWASISGEFYSYTLDSFLNTAAAGNAGSIQLDMAVGNAVNSVNWIMPLNRIIFGTTLAETTARSSSLDEPLTPTLCVLKNSSSMGSAPVSPVVIDSRGIFLQRNTTKVYELAYDYYSNDYQPVNLMRLNDEIGQPGISYLCAQRQPDTYIWMIRDDGQAVVLLYEPKEKVAGFCRVVMGQDGLIENACVLPTAGEDRVYFIVNRTIDGVTKRYIEKLNQRSDAVGDAISYMADCNVFDAGPTLTVSAPQLANCTDLVGWGTTSGVSGPITGLTADGSGVISLGASYTDVVVGIPYTWRYKSAKLAYGTRGETPMGKPKRVGKIGVVLADFMPQALSYGADFTTLYPMPSMEDYVNVSQTAVQATYDEQSFPFGGGQWDTDSRICMTGDAPYPVTLLGIIVDMMTNT